MTLPKHTLYVTWLLLFFSIFIVLPVMFSYNGTDRINIPYGQYYFFTITSLSTLVYAFYFWPINWRFLFKNTLFILTSLLVVDALISAKLGITPFYGMRLAVIVSLTSLPFIIAGHLSVQRPMSYALPFLLYAIIIIFGTLITANVGPLKIGPVFLTNYLWGDRWSFWYREANGLGVMAALSISTLLYFISISKKHPIAQIALFLLFFATCYLLMKSASRSALLWAFSNIMLVSYFWATSLQKKWQFFLLVVSVIFMIVIYHFFCCYTRPELQESLKTASLLPSNIKRAVLQTYTSTRWDVWLASLKQFKTHPFFGYGFGAEVDFLHHQPHLITGNIYIRLLGESGLFSFILVSALLLRSIFLTFKHARKYWNTHPKFACYALFLLIGLTGIMFEQLGDAFLLRIEEINYLFFFFVGAAFALENYANR